ncbi:MAG: lytic murein transglycosylase B [Sulfuricella sp.]|nr:lytic murein transglycosylase B [Sulfuricella sp.]
MNPGKLWVALALLWPFAGGQAASFADRPDVHRFVVAMVDKHGFDAGELNRQFSQVKPRPRIARMMTGQFVKAPDWSDYRANFVNPRNIARGVEFWSDNAEALARARQTYGVPEEIIIAILGVETRYGKFPLPYRVFDSLATLAFDYPRRAEFFRNELEQYLLLMREEKRNPLVVKGSFAGAMGIPQFMPSSYRSYAVDFDGDGRRDLLRSPSDAIGSVANYLNAYGWVADELVALRAEPHGEAIPGEMLAAGLKPERPVEEWLARHVEPAQPLPPATPVAMLAVNGDSGTEYWLGLNNFYVISRYNRSLFYALSVYQLGEEIRAARLAKQF